MQAAEQQADAADQGGIPDDYQGSGITTSQFFGTKPKTIKRPIL